MATGDADVAARLIERLLADPGFRADFRRDPAAACRSAGLDELAEEMAFGAGKAMQTLEVRESRSSLAGVMMAAALEGVGVLGFVEHVVPGAVNAPGLVRDVLSKVSLPKVDAPFDGVRGALAAGPAAPSGAEGAGEPAADVAAPGQAAAASVVPTAAPPAGSASPGAGALPPASDAAASGADAAPPASDATASGADATPAASDAAASGAGATPASGVPGTPATAAPADAPVAPAPAAATAEDVPYEEAPPDPVAAQVAPAGAAPPDAVAPQAPRVDAAPPSAAPEAAQPSGAPVDPAQFGADGKGGPPDAAAQALLENKNVVLDGDGTADIKAGRIDPRVVAVLTKLSEEHKITVSCMCSDHSKLTAGGSVSNHHFGRGMDIAAVDGIPVNADNAIAHEIAAELSSLDPSYRPDEIGSPWALSPARGYFTDADHSDHIHVAFKKPIERAPALAAGQPTADPAAAASVPPPAPAAGQAAAVPAAAAGVPPAAPVGSSTLRFAVHRSPGASGSARDTLGFTVLDRGGGDAATPAAAAPQAPAAAAPQAPAGAAPQAPAAAVPQAPAGAVQQAPAAGAAAEQLVAGGGAEPAGGAKALAALAEAMKYKGTDYKWGGSNPQTGFDCSGLVQWAYAKQGIQIPRVTDQQILATNGTAVDRKALAPGDLVFFRDPSGYVHHVGISMGGDKFLHAPHTGDVVKESSLSEPYYAQQFTGGRRFDATAPQSAAAIPQAAAVQAAHVALDRDAAAARNPSTLLFKALSKQEASHHNSTVRFMRAIRPEEARGFQRAVAAPVAPAAAPVDPAPVALDPAAVAASLQYPGDDATKQQLAAWLAASAQKAGLPPELPVMAALVESGVANLDGGHADSVGFFQMRVGIWNKGEYAGYPENPALQVKWFIDHALAVKQQRLAAGDAGFGTDPSTWGNWIADIERPAEQYRGRYQLRLAEARALLGKAV